MYIVKKLDLTVNFGAIDFKGGQIEWATMAFSEKYRWAFPLVPTSCDYAKSDDYFGKLRALGIEVPQSQGGFGGDVSVRNVLRTNKQRLQSKMGSLETAISETGARFRILFCELYIPFRAAVGVQKPGKLREIEDSTI